MSKIGLYLRLLKTRWAALTHDIIMIPIAWMLSYWIRYKIGEYPDLVTGGQIPSFIEVKKYRLTEKKSKSLAQQIGRYMGDGVIQATLNQLKKNENLTINIPKKYVAIEIGRAHV